MWLHSDQQMLTPLLAELETIYIGSLEATFFMIGSFLWWTVSTLFHN